MEPGRLERNVRLIPVAGAFTRAMFWLPIFVLFTRARFDLDGALQLGAIYYLAVVVLEVPSGWMSDRLGRVVTLRFAAVSFVAAQGCFLLGDDRFAVIALGQVFLAGGFASVSGTDVSFHYDTLEALGRSDQFSDRQAKVSSIGFLATAGSAVVGGALGLVDLRLAFAASLLSALCQLAVTTRLTEPPHTEGRCGCRTARQQLATCVRYLRSRYLGWIFFYGVLMVTLEHVAFTLMQPWLTNVLDRSPDDLGSTPLFTGTIFAVTALVGSLAARTSAPLSRRFGVVATLVGFAVLSAIIVTAMALAVSAAVLVLYAFRSAQGAAAPVLIAAEVGDRVQRAHRATFLSLDSLAGRLGYGSILLFVSADAGDDVQGVLGVFSVIAWVLVGILIVSGVMAVKWQRESAETDQGPGQEMVAT